MCSTNNNISDEMHGGNAANTKQYWAEVPATVDGMLGGYGSVSNLDIQGSKMFLRKLLETDDRAGCTRALDCGAGIGRITKHLLLPMFDKVDMVEQNEQFVEKSKDYIGPKLYQKVGTAHAVDLQDFAVSANEYDVIWIQWVLAYVKDDALVEFLKDCRCGLKPNGLIVIKENVTSSDLAETDEEDSAVTRPLSQFREIFHEAGLECCQVRRQSNFPKFLYNVYMFALRPEANSKQCNQEHLPIIGNEVGCDKTDDLLILDELAIGTE